MASFLDRLLGRPEPEKHMAKAVTSLGPWATGIPLSSFAQTPQDKAAAYLRAYKVGWFYKAGKKIADDIASLDWSVSAGDMEEGAEETTLPRPDLSTPFASLSPIDQFMRLIERPNPTQTGRQLMRKTEVRLDFAGAAALYLEGADFGLPTAIYGISPARMWPSRDKAGNLIGWVMDYNSPSGGVPFSPNEILWLSTGNAEDDDTFGTSVVEAVYAQVPLTELMARHTADVLQTGGRLAGMLSPKDRALTEDEFSDAVKAWRNVTSQGDAAKRLLIFPEPMEYTAGASTPAEIGIPELAALNRDDILSAFPVGPEMLGVPMPAGLNASGESRAQLRKFYWEDTIHPRADLIEEAIQVGLLSLYEKATGQTFDFELEEPNLDDASSIIEKVGALKGLVKIGFDPKEAVSAVGLEHIKWLGLPAEPAPPVAPAAEADVTSTAQGGMPGDQVTSSVPVAKSTKARPKRQTERAVKEAQAILTDFLEAQRARLSERIRDTMPKGKADRSEHLKASPDDWWEGPEEDQALRESLRGLYLKIGRESLQVVAEELNRVVYNAHVKRILADLLTYGGERITHINEATRDAVKAQLAEGVRRGYSINQLIEGVPDETYAGVANAVLDNGTPAFDAYRAEVISRTETMLSYNRAAIAGYDQFGVKEVQAIDGDYDEVCAERDGQTFSIEDAFAIEDHPNGTLDWIPVLDKAAHEPSMSVAPVTNVHVHMAETKIAQEPPVVNVTNEVPVPSVSVESPSVNVEAPMVNVTNDVQTPQVINEVAVPSVTVTNEVQSPEVNVTNEVVSPSITVNNEIPVPSVNVTNEVQSPDVHVTNEVTSPDVTVNVPEQRPVTKTIHRNQAGLIERIEETPDGG